jgi:hypothetical protein
MKRSDKQKEKRQQIIGMIAMGIVLFMFILLGFVIKQECDIDAEYLWCRLHPFTIGDVIGVPLFVAGAVLISGLLPYMGINLYNPANSSQWNIISFIGMLVGIILFWNL